MPGITIGGNGGVDLLDAPYDLGELLFEQRPVTVTVAGERRTFVGWVCANENYPRRLQARLDRARRKYRRVADPLVGLPRVTAKPGEPEYDEQVAARDDALEDPDVAEAMDMADEAWQEYVTTAITILVPDLTHDLADVIHTDRAVALLEELGYFPKVKADEGQRKEASGGDAAPLTGTTPPPSSATSTPDSTLSGSST